MTGVKQITLGTRKTKVISRRKTNNMLNEMDEVDDDFDIIQNKGRVSTRTTVTGKVLDQKKMLKRKLKNCGNEDWIEMLDKGNSYQVHLRLKTGLYEPLASNFVVIMNKNFNICLKDKNNPENSIKHTRNGNGIERTEYDLTLDIDNEEVGFKVKMYLTKSTLDV